MDESVADDLLSVVQAGEDWEAAVFEAACAGAREIAGQLLPHPPAKPNRSPSCLAATSGPQSVSSLVLTNRTD